MPSKFIEIDEKVNDVFVYFKTVVSQYKDWNLMSVLTSEYKHGERSEFFQRFCKYTIS